MFRVRSFVIGAVVFVIAHGVEVVCWSWFLPAGDFTPWFLNAGRAVAFTAASLAIAAAAAGAAARAHGRDMLIHAANVAAGAVAAMAVVLMINGPGTIFPIALVFGALIAVLSSLAGALLAAAIRRPNP